MKTKEWICRAFLLVIISYLAACAESPFVRQSPDFSARCQTIRDVAIVPPEAEFVRVVVGGNKEALTEESTRVARELTELVGVELAKHSFRLKAGAFDNVYKARSAENRAVSELIQKAYDELDHELYGKKANVTPKEALAYECSLGPEISKLAKDAKADALFLVRFNGFKRSGGSVAGEMTAKVLIGVATMGLFVTPQDPIAGAVVEAALVDGSNGDVLWGNRVNDIDFGLVPVGYERGDLAELVSKLFASYPK